MPEGELAMGRAHTPADDIVHDLLSIQYHALQAAQLYDQYTMDADDRDDVAACIREWQEQDVQRAVRCHELLRELSSDGLG